MTDWWIDTDASILECLREAGPLSPGDLGRRVGISSGEATTFICLLAAQGKVKISLVEAADSAASPMGASWDLVRHAMQVTADA